MDETADPPPQENVFRFSPLLISIVSPLFSNVSAALSFVVLM